MGAAAGYGATQFTFHYASTLIDIDFSVPQAWTPFTFHYASTLIYHHADPSTFSVHIYIPLCFYFNRSKKVEELAKEIYLHSTMLLL